jgi:hypothetical protein
VLAAAVRERQHALITSNAQLHAIRRTEVARNFAFCHAETDTLAGCH